MIPIRTQIGRLVSRSVVTATLLVALTAPAAAHGGGGMMGGGSGVFGGTMGLWGLLWLGLLVGLVMWLARDGRADTDDRALSALRERYARGDLSEEEFERRRDKLG